MSLRARITLALSLAGTAAACALPAPADAQQSSVAVVRCPTTYGVRRTPPKLPARLGVVASPAATKRLVAYSNGVLILLAPRDWHCHALVGADGSAAITVAAGSTTDVREPAITEHFASTPAAAGVLACALFPAAAQQLPRGVPCPVHKPARETTASLRAHALSFADPAHVRGDGVPSGGSDSAHGVMAFLAASSGFTGYAFAATCTLRAASRAICMTVLDDALTRIPANE